MQTYKIKNEIFVGFIPKIITQLPKDFDWGSEDLFQRKLVNRILGHLSSSSSKPACTFCISSSDFYIDTSNVAILCRTLWCRNILLFQWTWLIHNIACKTSSSSSWITEKRLGRSQPCIHTPIDVVSLGWSVLLTKFLFTSITYKIH